MELEPHSLGIVIGPDPAMLKHVPLHTCYYTEFCKSRSNGTIVIRDPPEIFDPSRPAFQGHSRSLEPTRIDRLPMTSC